MRGQIADRKRHVVLRRSLLLITIALLFDAASLMACPEETVRYPPFTVRQLRGKIEPPHGHGLLPTEVKFLVREKGTPEYDREVPVQPDGTFVIGVAEGVYEFEVKAEGFLFTLVGEVTVSLEANEKETITLWPPWC